MYTAVLVSLISHGRSKTANTVKYAGTYHNQKATKNDVKIRNKTKKSCSQQQNAMGDTFDQQLSTSANANAK